MKRKREYYCTKCGRKMIEYNAPAEDFSREKYSMETGKRQYIRAWKCPKYSSWNFHDNMTFFGENPFHI